MVDAIAINFLERFLALLAKEGQLLHALDGQFDKMKMELSLMQSYLKEAEKVKKKNQRYVLMTITKYLRELIYDAEDVIADYQILILKQQKERLPNYISSYPLFMISQRNITKRLMKINQEIEEVKKSMVSYLSFTTRNKEEEEEEIARSMVAIDKHIHTPEILSDEDGWALFVKVAFACNEGKCPSPDLELVAKEIFAKCKGIPLAIKAVGGMMRGKGHQMNEWKRISTCLKEEHNEGEMVMSYLKLSYEELPADLKPCFLCFSMYPENIIVFVDEIVGRWISEGFVSARNGKTAFQVGEEYIVELMNRCLIVGTRKDEFQRKFTFYGIHHMVREMVINIARDENFTSLDENHKPVFGELSRRVGISRNSETMGIRDKKVKKLRTLFGLFIEKEAVLNIKVKLCELKWLRVLYLALSETIIDSAVLGKDWLDGIGSLLHLVYLHISNCTLEKIPNLIENLYNLQILAIMSWPNLKMLPSSISKLDKLIALDIRECNSLDYLPDGIGSLWKLERLSWFTPTSSSHKNASQICQLKNFSQLRELVIKLRNLEQLGDRDLNVLSELLNLQDLTIIFGDDSDKIIASESKLNQMLSPLRHLEVLRLTLLPGEITPIWLNPTTFPNLQFLGIDRGNRLAHMGPEFWGREHYVWRVEVLNLYNVPELEEKYERFRIAMPYLRKLNVGNCPKLSNYNSTGVSPTCKSTSSNCEGATNNFEVKRLREHVAALEKQLQASNNQQSALQQQLQASNDRQSTLEARLDAMEARLENQNMRPGPNQ